MPKNCTCSSSLSPLVTAIGSSVLELLGLNPFLIRLCGEIYSPALLNFPSTDIERLSVF